MRMRDIARVGSRHPSANLQPPLADACGGRRDWPTSTSLFIGVFRSPSQWFPETPCGRCHAGGNLAILPPDQENGHRHCAVGKHYAAQRVSPTWRCSWRVLLIRVRKTRDRSSLTRRRRFREPPSPENLRWPAKRKVTHPVRQSQCARPVDDCCHRTLDEPQGVRSGQQT